MRPRSIAASGALMLMMAAPLDAQEPWQLVEDLRIGGEGSEMTMFTDVRGVVVGPQGHIFVLDFRPQQIRVFDRSGKFVTLAARKGQGPGEIGNANGLVLVRDTVWVNDPGNGRWSAYSAVDGRYLRQFIIPIRSYGFVWEARADAEGRIVDPIRVPTGRADPATGRDISEPRLRRVRTNGTVADTIPSPQCTQRNPPARTAFTGTRPPPNAGRSVYGIPYLATPITVLDGRAGYWCAPNEDYLLVHRPLVGSDTLHVARKPYTRVPLPKDVRDKLIGDARTFLSRFPVVDADYSLIPTVYPVFQYLDVDDKGQLWARRKTSGAASAVDIYDATGKQIAAATLTVPFETYLPLHTRGDFVYGVVRDEDEIPHIVRARIVRGGR
jgi:hypothetical protein